MRLHRPTARGGVAALLAVALSSAGCFRAEWRRISRYEPVPPARDAALVVGSSGLDECLATYGAPLWVREHPVQGQDGTLLAWGWFRSSDFGFRVSYTFERFVSASFDWQQIDAEMQGLVAIFDADWRLVSLDRGLLRDLVQEGRSARPTARVGAQASSGG